MGSQLSSLITKSQKGASRLIVLSGLQFCNRLALCNQNLGIFPGRLTVLSLLLGKDSESAPGSWFQILPSFKGGETSGVRLINNPTTGLSEDKKGGSRA